MKTTVLKYCSIVIIALMLSACGGGDDGATGETGDTGAAGTPGAPGAPGPSPVRQFISLTNMVDIIIGETVDSAQDNLIDIDNFFIQDDIDGDVFAEDELDNLVDSLLSSQNSQ